MIDWTKPIRTKRGLAAEYIGLTKDDPKYAGRAEYYYQRYPRLVRFKNWSRYTYTESGRVFAEGQDFDFDLENVPEPDSGTHPMNEDQRTSLELIEMQIDADRFMRGERLLYPDGTVARLVKQAYELGMQAAYKRAAEVCEEIAHQCCDYSEAGEAMGAKMCMRALRNIDAYESLGKGDESK